MIKKTDEANSRAIIFEALMANQGRIVSGAALAEKLSITRQALSKNIAALKAEGLPVASVSQKGYMMQDIKDTDVLSSTQITYILRDNPLFNRCICLKETDSTQSVIKKMARDGEEAGVIATAEVQKMGRGRRGRNWQSVSGKNLMFSMLLRPPLLPGEVQLLNLAAGLSLKKTLRTLCALPAELKWPNDILCSGRKLCGILSESAGEAERIYYAVTGIGVNINMAAEDIPDELRGIATSVFIESGKTWPRWKILVDFLGRFASAAALLCSGGGPEALLELYRKECDTIGKKINVICDNESFSGTASGITGQGALVVKTNDGEKIFAAADVVHLR